MMKTLLIALAVAAFWKPAVASDNDVRSGVWAADLQDDHLEMTLFHGRDHQRSTLGFDVPLADLSGLSRADLTSSAANVQFEFRRAAGTIAFDGRVANGTGAGHYRFTPSEAFVRDMTSLGYRNFKDSILLMFATENFTPQTVRDLRAMGYDPSQRDLEEIAIFRVTPDFLRDMASAGYPNLSLREAVNFRVGRVDAAYLKQMRELGYANIEARQLADLAILGVTPKFIQELKALGYEAVSAHQLEDMKALGVTPDYIRKLSAKGYHNVPVEKLLRLREMGADEILFK